MKKIFLALLIVACAFALTACGNNDEILENNEIDTVDSGEEIEIVKDFEVVENPSTEKITEIYLEGMPESVDWVTLKSSLGYTIQYDAESLAVSREGATDYYRAIDNEKVYFTIEILPAEQEITAKKAEYGIGEYETYEEYFKEGYNWDSLVYDKKYVKTENKIYVLTAYYFFEATEGWGSRISQMFDTFKAQ